MSDFFLYKKTVLDPSDFSFKGLTKLKKKLYLDKINFLNRSNSVSKLKLNSTINNIQNSTVYSSKKTDKVFSDNINKNSAFRVMYKKIFENFFYTKKSDEKNNMLNLMMVNSEDEFYKEMEKIKKSKEKIKKIYNIKNVKPSQIIEKEINYMKNRLNFIRGVSTYSFPKIMISKIKETNKKYLSLRRQKYSSYKPPYQSIDNIKNDFEINKTLYFKKSFNINHY